MGGIHLVNNETTKTWRCRSCGHPIGTVVQNGRLHVLRVAAFDIQGRPQPMEIEGGTVQCPECGQVRRWVIGEELLRQIIKRQLQNRDRLS